MFDGNNSCVIYFLGGPVRGGFMGRSVDCGLLGDWFRCPGQTFLCDCLLL